MKVVIDTNILLVSIPKKSKYRLIFDSLLDKKYTLAISNDILNEYFEIISDKTNELVAVNIAEMLNIARNVEKNNIYYKWNLIETDKDDNKFVDCAIVSNADYIVTNDKHFNILEDIDFPKITVINIDEFLKLLQK